MRVMLLAMSPTDRHGRAEVGTFCPYPAASPPVPVPLTVTSPHPCPYLPGRTATTRAFAIEQLPGRIYHQFMDAGFRRSGQVIYQTICRGCRQCLPIRVPVERFAPDKSQRRCFSHNDDLAIEIDLPAATDEKYALYQRYQAVRHDDVDENDPAGRESFERFLYHSPVESLEFCYRDQAGQLLAVGICDACSASLSSVYFFYDPLESKRGLGTYGALREIAFARRHGIPYYYLGFWIEGSAKMDYKSRFKPHEILQPTGLWTDPSNVGNAPMDKPRNLTLR